MPVAMSSDQDLADSVTIMFDIWWRQHNLTRLYLQEGLLV
jgi:hypothetical protein